MRITDLLSKPSLSLHLSRHLQPLEAQFTLALDNKTTAYCYPYVNTQTLKLIQKWSELQNVHSNLNLRVLLKLKLNYDIQEVLVKWISVASGPETRDNVVELWIVFRCGIVGA